MTHSSLQIMTLTTCQPWVSWQYIYIYIPTSHIIPLPYLVRVNNHPTILSSDMYVDPQKVTTYSKYGLQIIV